MDIIQYLARFFYRIRYWLLYGSIAVTGLVFYFTRFLPKTYTVNTTIFTGIVSGSTLTADDKPMPANNAFDNIINLVKARSTIENVAIKLFALSMIHGDPNLDNHYITAKNYNKLLSIVPEDVAKLINKKSLDSTIVNLQKYMSDDPDNFVYWLLNGEHPHYSYEILSQAKIKRLGNSDIIEIEYQSDDPGLAHNTVKFLSDELFKKYEEIRYKSSNDVIRYFQLQLDTIGGKLHTMEDSLTNYNVSNRIINYAEQTKALALQNSAFETKYEQMLLDSISSTFLVQQLEKQLENRVNLLYANKSFLNELDNIAAINGKITEIESFNSTDSIAPETNEQLQTFRKLLEQSEKKLQEITIDINALKTSKEGVAIEELVSQWLSELIKNIKSKAELKVMEERRKLLNEQYNIFSPVGTNLKRREREINLAETSYLQFERALNEARLRQKNIEMTTSALNVITPPTFPLLSNPGKRMWYILAALFGSILFIIGYFLLIELLDKTLRDATRAFQLTKLKVLGVFPGKGKLRFRGYTKACNRMAATYICNQLNNYLVKGDSTIFNLLSCEKQEGKSYIAKYLKESWEELGFTVKIITYKKDFPVDSREFVQAQSIYTLYKFPSEEPKPDILLVEYPPLIDTHIPTALLKEAQLNLLIADGCRAWKDSDSTLVKQLLLQIPGKPIYLILNKTERESVEDFTGQLPPYTPFRNMKYRLYHFGITADKA